VILAMVALASAPIVIAHRGASGERPEHTIAAYELAIEQGADFIEPDLVLTKDGVLVARHENEISGTTDVAAHPEFATRKATKTIDGESVTGWFTEDFTLAELRTLRARERLPALRPANAAFDGQFKVPTFEEIIALAKARSKATGRVIGIYPETKHPSYFASIGLPHEAKLLAALKRAGWTTRAAPVFIQSFETGNLERLARKTNVRLIQLVDAEGGPADKPGVTYTAMLTPAGLKGIARYAAGIGPNKALVIPRKADGTMAAPTGLVSAAHAAGLAVHPWTMRAENFFLPKDLQRGDGPSSRGDLKAEIAAFYAAGVDGVFSDFPGIAVSARGGAASPPAR
jgi:glycerophosphoryl diester phosphodiesterase